MAPGAWHKTRLSRSGAVVARDWVQNQVPEVHGSVCDELRMDWRQQFCIDHVSEQTLLRLGYCSSANCDRIADDRAGCGRRLDQRRKAVLLSRGARPLQRQAWAHNVAGAPRSCADRPGHRGAPRRPAGAQRYAGEAALAGMSRTGPAKQRRALNVSDRQGFNESNGVWRWQYDR
jgi:hypothetical protein